MRCITITYDYDGDEAAWTEATSAFISALNDDPKANRFSYQVAVADNGASRVHWGRWDSAETLAHVQSQTYFKEFAAKVGEFSGGTHKALGTDIKLSTQNW